VNWKKYPNDDENLCYFAPRGVGDDWNAADMGCHNPRLDLDNISCTPSESDPQSFDFCAPENINVDFPPNDQWTRIGAYYYPGTSDYGGTVTPTVKIFCDGSLAAELGPMGYSSPVTFSSGDYGRMWLVADVLFRETECVSECIVQPIQEGGAAVILGTGEQESTVGPAYPPVPL
jgi:hypothetical protein